MFDQSCADLAESFLENSTIDVTTDNVSELAQVIQDAIEEWLRDHEEDGS